MKNLNKFQINFHLRYFPLKPINAFGSADSGNELCVSSSCLRFESYLGMFPIYTLRTLSNRLSEFVNSGSPEAF